MTPVQSIHPQRVRLAVEVMEVEAVVVLEVEVEVVLEVEVEVEAEAVERFVRRGYNGGLPRKEGRCHSRRRSE